MANYATLKQAIQQVVKTNGNNEITGALLQQSLLAIIDSLGSGYQFAGVATPQTNPGTPDYNIAYIAGPGVYANFGDVISILPGFVGVFKYNGTWTQENFAIIDLFTRTEQNVIANKYWNTGNTTVGGSYNPSSPTTLNGQYCVEKLSVLAGDVFEFYGIGSNAAQIKTFVITDSSHSVLQISNLATGVDYRVNPYKITIPENGANLYVNFSANYSSATDKLYKLQQFDLSQLSEQINELIQAVAALVQLSTTIGSVSSLKTNAKDTLVNAINEIFDKFFDEQNVAQSIISGKYWITTSATIGASYEGVNRNLTGYYKTDKIPVQGGDVFEFYGIGSNSSAVKTFVITDSSDIVIAVSNIPTATDYRESPYRITIPQNGAHLFVNFGNNYVAETDKLIKVITTEIKLKTLVEEINALTQKIENVDSQILFSGKTIVCFGDSITEFVDPSGKHYSDYLQEISGANVVNVGIGGTRLSQRTTPVDQPTNNLEAFAALDICNMVKASCEQNFTQAENGALWIKNNSGDDNTEIVARLRSIDWGNVDVVTIFAGTNDWSVGTSLGQETDTTPNTVLGAMNYISTLLTYTYPNVKVYFFCPPMRIMASENFRNGFNSQTSYVVGDEVLQNHTLYRFINNHLGVWDLADVIRVTASELYQMSGDVEERGGNTLKVFCNSVLNQAKINHLPNCDMYNEMWTPYNWPSACNSDLTHPLNALAQIAQKFFAFIFSHRNF